MSEEKAIGPEALAEIRKAMHDVLALYGGTGRVVIDFWEGKVRRVGMDVTTWAVRREDKGV
jgi:hypothetical protein